MKREYEMEVMHIAAAKIYRYKSVTFEWHDHFGPTILRMKDYEPRPIQSISLRQWGEFGQWFNLPTNEREEYRVL